MNLFIYCLFYGADLYLEAVFLHGRVRKGFCQAVFADADRLNPVAEQNFLHLAVRVSILFELDDDGILQGGLSAGLEILEKQAGVDG